MNKESNIDLLVFQKAMEKYVNHPLRAAIVAIPIIGSSIDVFISSQGQIYQQKRLDRLILNLKNEIKSINENNVDKEFLNSEEFFDILLNSFDKCIGTNYVEKIRFNAKILVGSILKYNKDEREFTETFLNAVANLTPKDLILGQIIYEQQKGELPEFNDDYNELRFIIDRGWNIVMEQTGFNQSEFKIRLYNLASGGLIKEVIGVYVGYTGGKYIITDLFRKLMEFIKYSSDPLFSSKIS